MEWKNYWDKVVQRYRVKIEGWPSGIPFANLSEASSALPELKNLLQQWQDGRTHWRKLSHTEYTALELEHNHQIETQEISPPAPRRRRSDYGKKRSRGKYKSVAEITQSNDEDEDTDTIL